MNRETWLAHAGSEADPMTGALVPPIHSSTTFRRDDQYQLPTDFVYGRYTHPLAVQAENALAELDGGGAALVFNSGLAAMAAVIETVPTGSAVAIPEVMYHGGRDLVLRARELGRLVVHTFDSADPSSLAAMASSTDLALIWVETVANPMWVTADIEAIATIAQSNSARLVVDSTVTPPVCFRPLEHGADLVFHSATKYLNGHSDVTAGVLVGREDDPRMAEMEHVRKLAGSVLPPFETWLLLRGLRTLHLRFERACANAAAIAVRVILVFPEFVRRMNGAGRYHSAVTLFNWRTACTALRH